MLVDRKELVKMLDDVRPALNKAEQDSIFTFSDKSVETFNGEIAIKRNNSIQSLKLEGHVLSEGLYTALSKLSTEKVDITKRGNELVLSAGRIRAGIPMLEDAEGSGCDLDDLTWHDLPDGFLNSIEVCSFSVGPDSGAPAESCVYVNMSDGVSMSCDGFRATKHTYAELDGLDEFLLPAGPIKTILDFKPTGISVPYRDSWVHFGRDQAILSVRRYSTEHAKYDDVKSLFNFDAIGSISMPETLPESIQRLTTFAKEEISGDDHIEILVSEGVIKFSSRGIRGWIEEEADIDYSGDDISFALSASYLGDIVNGDAVNAPCEVGENRIMFKCDDWEHVVGRYVV